MELLYGWYRFLPTVVANLPTHELLEAAEQRPAGTSAGSFFPACGLSAASLGVGYVANNASRTAPTEVANGIRASIPAPVPVAAAPAAAPAAASPAPAGTRTPRRSRSPYQPRINAVPRAGILD